MRRLPMSHQFNSIHNFQNTLEPPTSTLDFSPNIV